MSNKVFIEFSLFLNTPCIYMGVQLKSDLIHTV